MHPIRWIKTYVLGLLSDARTLIFPAPPQADLKPLPPRIPPQAVAMVTPPPALDRVNVAGRPLRGSLRDRMRKAR